MTHDELLAKINEALLGWQELPFPINETAVSRKATAIALRAVVELHKPVMVPTGASTEGDTWFQEECSCRNSYPCSTIQAIEKELG